MRPGAHARQKRMVVGNSICWNDDRLSKCQLDKYFWHIILQRLSDYVTHEVDRNCDLKTN